MSEQEKPMVDKGIFEIQEEIQKERDMHPQDTELEAFARMKMDIHNAIVTAEARLVVEIDQLKANTAAITGRLRAKDSQLDYHHAQLIQTAVWNQIRGKTRRSVDTVFGRLGYKKKVGRVKMHRRDTCDEETLLKWAEKNYPAAVSTEKKVLLQELKGVKCPHTLPENIPEEDNFYYKPLTPKKPKEKTDAE